MWQAHLEAHHPAHSHTRQNSNTHTPHLGTCMYTAQACSHTSISIQNSTADRIRTGHRLVSISIDFQMRKSVKKKVTTLNFRLHAVCMLTSSFVWAQESRWLTWSSERKKSYDASELLARHSCSKLVRRRPCKHDMKRSMRQAVVHRQHWLPLQVVRACCETCSRSIASRTKRQWYVHGRSAPFIAA